MNKFSLSTSKRKALPDTVTVDGSVFRIKTDFRVILRITKMFSDVEIPEEHKMMLFCKMFFVDDFPLNGAIEAFQDFVRCGQDDGESSEDKDFDFEEDAAEIYSGFMQIYHIDLFIIDLHWWQFRALLSGLFAAKTALSQKVELRHMDDNDSKRKASLERAKRNVAIKESISFSELQLQKELERRLINGESLEGLGEY